MLARAACTPTQPASSPIPTTANTPAPTVPPEPPIIHIPLSGPITKRKAEVSGIAWYDDYLILLPQYPRRLDDAIFALPKASILAYLNARSSAPLEPQAIAFADGAIAKDIQHFQGYEAIAFAGDRAFLTIESGRDNKMMGYLVAGDIAPDLSTLTLDVETITPIAPQSTLDNTTDETLFIVGDTLVTLYERNGVDINAAPVAHCFDFDLTPRDVIPFLNIEYRITDATEPTVTSSGAARFWAINYFYPGDKHPAPIDPLAVQYGQGYTHRQHAWVERLVLFEYTEAGITRVDQPPLLLELSDAARNWEGLARLDDAESEFQRGFLLVTDEHPETILAFVPYP